MYFFQDRYVPKEEIAVSPDDRGYYFGDGIYEVFRVYGGKVLEGKAHFQRFQRSADGVRIQLPYSAEELNSIVHKLIDVNQIADGIVYMQVTRGAAPRAHAFPKQSEPILLAYTSEMERPLDTMRKGISAVTLEDTRWLHCDLKTLNLLANVIAKQHALDQGAGDVIFHRSGTVTESSSSNFMMVKQGELYTHPANNLVLHGITRSVVLRLAKQLHIPVHEQPFTLEQLQLADEAFLTSTTSEIMPVVQIDGRAVGDGIPGPVSRKLQAAFEQEISELT
ncbi:D-amino-acid transaminase [Paenibacillus thalictri]|uniref:D-alanine aminotransferase n=1 Tax=Paenibacillus thalictri TaxID=2527873 RepID=A0A4Q9DJ30_9BACL|nr:D-amino-acid transaminase [Paenibacillus thalictri]TBL73359.1 D-amino-acid transaminase [Paenibacillus thalictri]